VIFFSHQPQISNSSSLFRQNYSFPTLLKIPPCFRQIYVFFTYFMCFSVPPTFTMMRLCITQCTYWTPLPTVICQVPSVSPSDVISSLSIRRSLGLPLFLFLSNFARIVHCVELGILSFILSVQTIGTTLPIAKFFGHLICLCNVIVYGCL